MKKTQIADELEEQFLLVIFLPKNIMIMGIFGSFAIKRQKKERKCL